MGSGARPWHSPCVLWRVLPSFSTGHASRCQGWGVLVGLGGLCRGLEAARPHKQASGFGTSTALEGHHGPGDRPTRGSRASHMHRDQAGETGQQRAQGMQPSLGRVAQRELVWGPRPGHHGTQRVPVPWDLGAGPGACSSCVQDRGARRGRAAAAGCRRCLAASPVPSLASPSPAPHRPLLLPLLPLRGLFLLGCRRRDLLGLR